MGVTPLTPALANAAARSNGHLPRSWRDNGVMRWTTCQRCEASMVERVDDGKGVTGAMLDGKLCRGKA